MRNRLDQFSSSRAAQWLLSHRQFLLVLMLTLLHLRVMHIIPSPYDRVPLLLHFAMFLLWQPFISAQTRVGTAHLLVWIGIGGLIGVVGISWALLALWLILLAGIVGGQIFSFTQGRSKWFYLTALAYLIVMLLFHVIPHIIPETIEGERVLEALVIWGGPLLLLLMLILRESREPDFPREAIDLVYSLFVILILAVLVLGATSMMLMQQTGYIESLLSVIFAVAAMLLATSWLWNPAAGFSRLGAITSRYMLSIGLPFENWLRSLAEMSEAESDPERFLDHACHSLSKEIPFLMSCSCSVGCAESIGKIPEAKDCVETVFRQGELVFTLTSRQTLPPVMVWHINLITQLVARFYREKNSRRQLREMTYLQAVHETGARVTHDVKNMLQSLNALLFVVGADDNESNPRAQSLLRRQLPLISRRLQQTLNKLQVPDEGEKDELVPVESWWTDLHAIYETQGVRFELQGELSGKIPRALFASAAENLLQNALDKRAAEPDIDIVAELDMNGRLPTLSVRDSGSALPDQLVRDICRRPVASENGLGIGLFQLARLAGRAGYMLRLGSNRPGEVAFSLLPETSA
ncbi:MAG: hypothetical protein WAO76_15380 [Georgfuchsia sp.]